MPGLFETHFDRSYLISILSDLAKVPTHVPLGFETLMEPDHPKLVHYVQEVLRPELNRLGYLDLIEAGNNLIVKLGGGTSDKSLLIQNYTVTQHFNLMDNPFSGKIGSGREFGVDELVVFGQGVSQNKSHQAVMLALLKLIDQQDLQFDGTLYWAINNEGKSSHNCSYQILDELDTKPQFGLLQINTGMDLWLGNRGRADVNIHVRGRAGHSGSPQGALSAIEGANTVINRLKFLSWDDDHPQLGGRHALVYKIRYFPIAPHTLPSDAYLAVDRRLLPGDDLDQVVEEIKSAVGDLSPFEVDIQRGVTMLPAMVAEDLDQVKLLQDAIRSVTGDDPSIIYGQGAFDAGGLCERGIPTVMYGCSGGDGLLGTDFIPISQVVDEAKVLYRFILDFFDTVDL